MILIMKSLNFLSLKEIIVTWKEKIMFLLMYFFYENELTYPIYVSYQKFENSIDLLLISDRNKSHNVCIKDFNKFMSKKQK